MAQIRKQAEPDEPAGAPEWMVTFSDCMTLLLTFFVLMLSFSSFDEVDFRRLKIIFSKYRPSVDPESRGNRDAFLPTKLIQHPYELHKGSEKPTLGSGKKDHLREDTEPTDFYKRKVFLIPSDRVFLGKGIVISSAGRKILSTMATFLKEMPTRIVISENAAANERDYDKGMQRAWATIQFLVEEQGLDKNRLSLAATSLSQGYTRNEDSATSGTDDERVLEIILLERSIYN